MSMCPSGSEQGLVVVVVDVQWRLVLRWAKLLGERAKEPSVSSVPNQTVTMDPRDHHTDVPPSRFRTSESISTSIGNRGNIESHTVKVALHVTRVQRMPPCTRIGASRDWLRSVVS